MLHKSFAIGFTAVVLSGSISAQEWSYQSYNAAGAPGSSGHFRLTETSPGNYTARFTLPNPSACFRGESAAKVSEEGDLQLITLEPRMPGCATVRLALRKDGSGGERQELQPDGTWISDGMKRGLIRR